MELDPQESPEELKSREVEMCSEKRTSFASVVPPLRTAVETTVRRTPAAAQWRGAHCLNTAVILAVVHGLLGLSGSERAVEPLTFSPFLSLSPSLISLMVSCGRKATMHLNRLGRAVRR